MKDAECLINDDRLQLAAMRDPREATVSTYFERRSHQSAASQRGQEALKSAKSVDAFFNRSLPSMCMSTSVRYLLFTELLANTSEVFWYDDAVVDPVHWHDKFFSFVGINLPQAEVVTAARAASAGGSILGFPSKGLDQYPGGKRFKPVNWWYRDKLSVTSLSTMDDVLRVWLPPSVLEMLGVPLVTR